MKIVCTLISILAVILNYIELSSQSQRPAEPDARARSRSPNIEQTFPGVLGFPIEDLELLRLRPHNITNRVFQLRIYVFPRDKPIGLRGRGRGLNPMPTGEQIVLSTSNGDAYAILGKAASKTTLLRAICTPAFGRPERAKINMNSGEVVPLTAEEIEGCPVTVKEAITQSYEVTRISPHSESFPDSNSNPGVHRGRPSSSAAPSSSSSARSSSPAASPLRHRSRHPTFGDNFPHIFGYELSDLELIRLIPKEYPHVTFRLRRYTFPRDKPIGLMTTNHVLYPMPTGEQIVLSKSNGEVCGILERTPWNRTVVRPIMTNNAGVLERVKINMNSGAVEVMTDVELAECPGTNTISARRSYKVVHL